MKGNLISALSAHSSRHFTQRWNSLKEGFDLMLPNDLARF